MSLQFISKKNIQIFTFVFDKDRKVNKKKQGLGSKNIL
jgi:hypothetical protein